MKIIHENRTTLIIKLLKGPFYEVIFCIDRNLGQPAEKKPHLFAAKFQPIRQLIIIQNVKDTLQNITNFYANNNRAKWWGTVKVKICNKYVPKKLLKFFQNNDDREMLSCAFQLSIYLIN